MRTGVCVLEACLQMGRVRECSVFVIGCGKEAFDHVAGAQGTAVREQAVRDAEVDKVIDKCGISKCGTCGSSGDAGVIAKDECHERSRSRERLDEQRMEEMMKKWKLSTAQEAASRDALRFVMEPAKRAAVFDLGGDGSGENGDGVPVSRVCGAKGRSGTADGAAAGRGVGAGAALGEGLS